MLSTWKLSSLPVERYNCLEEEEGEEEAQAGPMHQEPEDEVSQLQKLSKRKTSKKFLSARFDGIGANKMIKKQKRDVC